MAELLTKIPTNLTEYPNSFKRQGAFPLEAYSVFYATEDKTAFEAAQDYATNNGIAYVGQTLAVVTTNVENSTVVDDVTFYIIADAAGTLQEVGKATNGDNNSITLTDGVLSLKGFDAAPNATLPQKAPVYVKDEEGKDTEVVDHYEIRWVAIDAIVDGDTNTKTIVAAADGETHVIIEDNYVEETDTHTYKVSLDLSAYATTAAVGAAIGAAKEELAGDISEAKTELQGAIDAVENKFDAAIGVKATAGTDDTEAVEATGIYKLIEEAEARAKAYADENDSDTIYDDTEITEDIADHESRIGAIESTIGDETQGLIKALADETAAREQGDTNTLNAAKTYTDEEITGLDIVIEKKTVENIESDYIVIKNKSGNEVASVNATKFVKDGMLDSAEYSTETKKLVLTWNTDAGKDATEIDLNDLVNTYTGSEHIVVGTDGVISIGEHVALDSDLTALDTKLSAVIDTKRTEAEVDAQIDAKLVSVNAEIAKKADAETTNAAIALKADQTALESAVETINGEIAKKADAEATTNALNNKVDKSEYTTDKASFALKSEVEGQFTSIGQRIDAVAEDVTANADAIEELGNTVAATYATKEALKATDDKAISNEGAISNLTSRLDGIVAQGGEPNVINNIKVNGVVQTIAEDKSVDLSIPVISNVKVSDLNDGQALLDRVTEAEADIAALETAVSGNQTGISTLTTRIAALETEVQIEGESRIDALEGQVATLINSTTTNTTDITNLKAEDARLAALIQGNTDKFANYYDKTTVDQLLTEIDLTSRVAVSDFETYKTAQAALIDTLATKSEVEAISTEVAKKANAADVYDKTTADATFVKEADFESKVDARLNTLIDGANAEDTITKVTDLVNFVNENAGDIAKLVTDVKANTDAIAENARNIAKNTSDIAALTTAVEAQKVIESTEISTTDVEGGVQLGIKEVNVNKLVQTTGDVLILNGGSATA